MPAAARKSGQPPTVANHLQSAAELRAWRSLKKWFFLCCSCLQVRGTQHKGPCGVRATCGWAVRAHSCVTRQCHTASSIAGLDPSARKYEQGAVKGQRDNSPWAGLAHNTRQNFPLYAGSWTFGGGVRPSVMSTWLTDGRPLCGCITGRSPSFTPHPVVAGPHLTPCLLHVHPPHCLGVVWVQARVRRVLCCAAPEVGPAAHTTTTPHSTA